MNVQFSISAKFIKKIMVILSLIVVWFVILSLAVEFLIGPHLFSSLASQTGNEDGKLQFFNLGSEQNFTTWYTSCMLLICAMLLGVIAAATGRAVYKYRWMGLSLIFLFLSADEIARLHERVSSVLGGLLNAGSFSRYTWIFLYAPFVIILGLAYWKFLQNLPTGTKRLFAVAGFLYVMGALGMEVIGGSYATFFGSFDSVHALLEHVEETLEMVGILVFFYALLSYISQYVKEFKLD